MREFQILEGDSLTILRTLPAASVHCCVTSPPYWGLRDYGVVGQMGLERTPEEYVSKMVAVFAEVRRVLRTDGTLWLNLGDSYAGSWGARGRGEGTNAARPDLELKHGTDAPNRKIDGLKPKDLVGIPWRVAFALQADGWYLRSDIIWHKPNPMPESVTDRPTKAHEYLFLLTKSERYAYDAEVIKEPSVTNGVRYPEDGGEPQSFKGSKFHGSRDLARHSNVGLKPRVSAAKGSFSGKTEVMAETGQNAFRAITETRNKRSVWTVSTEPYREAHFAVMPTALVEPCVLAGCPEGGTVLDPFAGSGTVGVVALRHGRSFIGCELNPAYAEMARERITNDAPMFNAEATA